QGADRGWRHLPGGGGRAAQGLGRPLGRGVHVAAHRLGRRQPRLRRPGDGQGRGLRRGADRHRRPAAEQAGADGRAAQGHPGHQEAGARGSARDPPGAGRDRGPQRAGPGEHLRQPDRRDRHRHDQAGRHGARRRAGARGPGLGLADQAGGGRRGDRRSATLQRPRLRQVARRAGERMSSPRKVRPKAHKAIRNLVDYGGPLVFLVLYLVTRDMIAATWALVAGSVVALAVGFITQRRITPLPLVAVGAALLFGSLTIVFHDERFVKIKPTVLNLGFAAFLLGGLVVKRNPLKALLGDAISLPDHAWRRLTINYGVFFLFVAGLNEFIWRTQPTDVWVLFRMPGLQILALAFSFTQVPLMMKYAQSEAPPPTE